MLRRTFIVAILGAGFLSACATFSTKPEPVQTHTVYLVRHAEKATDFQDPGLTAEGRVRAQLLADQLANDGVEFIHSTEYRRTQDTARPLALLLGLDIKTYDARDLDGFAEVVRMTPGTHVVVGHSNTTPQLAAILSGDDVIVMEEDEYTRFYTVSIFSDGKTDSVISAF